jgi:hypothetical protein
LSSGKRNTSSRIVGSGPIFHLRAVNLLLTARSASDVKAVRGGWTFGRSSTNAEATGGTVYVSGSRVVNVEVNEREQG